MKNSIVKEARITQDNRDRVNSKPSSMNKIATIIILSLCYLAGFSQDSLYTQLKRLADNRQFDEVISRYSGDAKNYSAESLYMIGVAYYMKQDDANCIKLMNLSIEKDPKGPKAYFIKASTLNYLSQFEEAARTFQSAIALKPDDAEYYSGLGDSYYNLEKFNLSITAYKTAIEKRDCPDRPYSMIAQIYADQKDNDKALEAFYVAKGKIDKKSDSYLNALFNIGLMESLKGNYDKAEPAFLELLQLAPSDYHTYAKLIQVYFGRKEYDKAKAYRDKLYEAHKKGLLEDNMRDMFCFDQFKWNDKLIQVFERFEEGSEHIYAKHIFYVESQEGKLEFKIQTEYDPLSVAQGGTKYLLCMARGNSHSTFAIGFNDDFKYEDLKKYVVDILEGKLKPAATSTN